MPGIVERHVHNSIAAGRDAAICSRLLFDLVGSQQMLALRAAKVGWVQVLAIAHHRRQPGYWVARL